MKLLRPVLVRLALWVSLSTAFWIAIGLLYDASAMAVDEPLFPPPPGCHCPYVLHVQPGTTTATLEVVLPAGSTTFLFRYGRTSNYGSRTDPEVYEAAKEETEQEADQFQEAFWQEHSSFRDDAESMWKVLTLRLSTDVPEKFW